MRDVRRIIVVITSFEGRLLILSICLAWFYRQGDSWLQRAWDLGDRGLLVCTEDCTGI